MDGFFGGSGWMDFLRVVAAWIFWGFWLDGFFGGFGVESVRAQLGSARLGSARLGASWGLLGASWGPVGPLGASWGPPGGLSVYMFVFNI